MVCRGVSETCWLLWSGRARAWNELARAGRSVGKALRLHGGGHRLNRRALRLFGAGRREVLARVAQLVERILGKDKVTGSIPVPGSTHQVVDGWPSG